MLKRALQKVMSNASKLGLTPAELDVARQYLEHREYGLCFDTIVTQLYERAITIDPDFFRSLEQVAREMNISPADYSFLKEPVPVLWKEPVEWDDTIPGEPEIIVEIAGTPHRIALYEGTFNTLMNYGVPGTDRWEGFLEVYHLHTGFYDQRNWQVPSTAIFLESIRNIPVPHGDTGSLAVQDKLVSLFEYAAVQALA